MGGASRPGQRTRTGDRSGWLARALDRLPVPDLAAGQGTAPAGGHRRDRLPDHPTRLVSDPVNVRGHRTSNTTTDSEMANGHLPSWSESCGRAGHNVARGAGWPPDAGEVARRMLSPATRRVTAVPDVGGREVRRGLRSSRRMARHSAPNKTRPATARAKPSTSRAVNTWDHLRVAAGESSNESPRTRAARWANRRARRRWRDRVW